jgi:hypothetical protein
VEDYINGAPDLVNQSSGRAPRNQEEDDRGRGEEDARRKQQRRRARERNRMTNCRCF